MSSSEAFVIINDWISEHYFTDTGRGETFQKQIRALRKIWDEDAADGHDTPVTRFSAERLKIQEALAGLSIDGAETAERARDAYARLRQIFGHHGQPEDLTMQRSQNDLTITATRLGEATDVLWLDATAVTGTDQGPDQVQLLGTNCLDDTPRPDQPVSKLLSELYLTETAPSFIVVAAGNVLFLTDRQRWPEGRYLAVDVQLVADRNETKKGGEIDRLLAVFSRNSLMPSDDGSIWWTQRLEESHQHAVGVSQDLRDGIRESIEIIANDVLMRRTDQGLSNDEIDGQDLARQSLRFLYRILFLLYAEAFPELGVLPKGAGEYDAGYGIDRLRELSMVELTDSREQQGTPLYESLALLFQLVNGDHATQQHKSPHEDELEDELETISAEGLVFESLEADLFMPEATHLINSSKLGNLAMQHILQRLLLSRSDSKGPRGFISYANLGINQLGAVYEGLMSYTGFIAETDLREVAKNGDASKGSWVVSVEKALEIDPKHLVTRIDEQTGIKEPVLHPKGSFVFRLSGRERQQSASFYTPEVMTKFVVSQALAELLDENTRADDILNLSICEPALGSGAFVIEAVRQLADEYLTRKQDELGQQIEPESYAQELQAVKAQIALHQVHGVDLNSTAVELAEVSLWLDTMQPGLHAPWFGLRLKRGNSLVGARRATYTTYGVEKKKYLTEAPEPAPMTGLADALERGSVDSAVQGRIHHFLLPGEGWGAGGKAKEVKDLVPTEQKALNDWARSTKTKLSSDQIRRLQGLAQRVETLWGLATRRLQIAESEARRFIDYWPREREAEHNVITREQIEASLANENGAYRRLKRVMDAWTALWYWPLTEREVQPPTIDQWIDALERILGKPGKESKFEGQDTLLSSADWDELNEFEELDLDFAGAARIDEKFFDDHPWLRVLEDVSQEQAFFHWELEFGPVFAHGGFDLQVGNPPWVRPRSDESALLAEFDPWWQLAEKPTQAEIRTKRTNTLSTTNRIDEFVDAAATVPALATFLRAKSQYPILSGLQPDLYRVFMERTWRSANEHGVSALVHPESHFTEKGAWNLRTVAYQRLRRHWQFINEFKLYEIANTATYGVHIYGDRRTNPHFAMAVSLYHQDTVERSLEHEGGTEVPGLKDSEGNWDTRPHRERILDINIDTLNIWARILDEPGTPPLHARMIYPVNRASMAVLEKLSHAPRVRKLGLQYSPGWHETADRKRGYFEVGSKTNASWEDVILQGPHFNVANPFAKIPNPTMKSHRDWASLDLEALPVSFIPRTSYQPVRGVNSTYDQDYGNWLDRGGEPKPQRNFYRIAWRRMASRTGERTLRATVIPPQAAHINTVQSAWHNEGDLESTVLLAGVFSSIVADFMIKIGGASDILGNTIDALPIVSGESIAIAIRRRAIALMKLTEAFDGLETIDRLGTAPISALRVASERRQALIEIDALVALDLGISIDELCTIYRTQFPVLRGYEQTDLYDANGRQIPIEMNQNYRQVGENGMTVEARTWVHPQSEVEYVFEFPFRSFDREEDMRAAYERFSRMLEDHGRIIEDED
ncbi:MAG: N-6 DNA methylase [Yaniella sp.]|nr:N-6 DNA methylase [Yaniella sp.]